MLGLAQDQVRDNLAVRRARSQFRQCPDLADESPVVAAIPGTDCARQRHRQTAAARRRKQLTVLATPSAMLPPPNTFGSMKSLTKRAVSSVFIGMAR
jgi:hypothetical protein